MNLPNIDIPEPWRVLATGITSIHGWPIFQALQQHLPDDRLVGIRPPKMDVPDGPNIVPLCITDVQALEKIRTAFNPTHVIHCAGVCDLDVCEERPDWAHAINVQGAAAMVRIFGDLPMLYVSTDLVFSGANPPTGGYTEDHATDPVSVVGRTFVLAEQQIQAASKHCIVRLALPLGDSINGQKGAVDWIEHRFKRHLPVTLFYDEVRSCVSCDAIASVTLAMLTQKLTGLYHFGGPKPWSLYDIGVYVFERGSYDQTLFRGMLRHEEKDGPPRIGDVSLNSSKLKQALNLCF
ncbi:MAG: sugar nucleotide-binding protein [Phycisphaerae bacterium]|nr:sugar nucleotide-binding protein [Phycisphaerae bacterium]